MNNYTKTLCKQVWNEEEINIGDVVKFTIKTIPDSIIRFLRGKQDEYEVAGIVTDIKEEELIILMYDNYKDLAHIRLFANSTEDYKLEVMFRSPFMKK